MENKFSKYQTIDNDFNCIVTSPEGKVIMKIADYMGKSTTRVIGKLIQDGDKVIYSKKVKPEHLMRKFENGVGINLNFIELLNDNDIIAVQIGKETYAITKFDAMLNGIKPKTGISGWERQSFIPLKFWKTENE